MPCNRCNQDKLPSPLKLATNALTAGVQVVTHALAGGGVLVAEKEFSERLAICRTCPRFFLDESKSGRLWPRCRECGCWLDARHKPVGKAWLKAMVCPLAEPKWKALP